MHVNNSFFLLIYLTFNYLVSKGIRPASPIPILPSLRSPNDYQYVDINTPSDIDDSESPHFLSN
jgi:hypothetical protein